MMKLFSLFTCALTLFAVTETSRAQEYVIGVEEISYAPYYETNGQDYRGFARDMLDCFAAKENIRFRYRPMPITRLYRELRSGAIDFKFPDHPLWGQKEKEGITIHYSQPVVSYSDVVMVLPEKQAAPLDALKTLGVVRGFSPWPFLEHINTGKISEKKVNSLKSLMKLTLDGRVEGAYFNEAVAKNLLKREFGNENALVPATQLPSDQSNYRISSVSQKVLLEKFNAFIAEGKVCDAYKKHNLSIVKDD